MKDILESKFLKEFCLTADNMYRLGWDERNGGNISLLLKDDEVKECLDVNKVKRVIPLMGVHAVDFDITPLIGKCFLVTGTGKYFKNVLREPSVNLGVVRIREDGKSVDLLWGFEDGGRPTSEFPAHMMSHIARLSVDPENRVVMHCHPTYTLAMNFVHPLDEKLFTKDLWRMCTECVVVFPDGIGVLPWLLCGTTESGKATAGKMTEYPLDVWAMHGIYGAGKDLDETFGLIETVEKAAQIYMLTFDKPQCNTISDDNMKQLVDLFGVKVKDGYLD